MLLSVEISVEIPYEAVIVEEAADNPRERDRGEVEAGREGAETKGEGEGEEVGDGVSTLCGSDTEEARKAGVMSRAEISTVALERRRLFMSGPAGAIYVTGTW